ncbi:MAG: L-tyrosine/L-tryptophan isonitrile synthase family protein [Oligoflexia bacterium]|nr:L-tyrosine/L-tryptophan isonitrile synthase family protein [Oligoflexia bacterium]
MELLQINNETPAKAIFEKLLHFGNFELTDSDQIDFNAFPIFNKIEEHCLKHEKLKFILPAFPAKSSNPDKTSGILPDLGEFIGLARLNQFCKDIQDLYLPGAEVIICSDGRVFNDLVFVGDKELKAYKEKINEIINTKNLIHLSTFDLEDHYDSETFEHMRKSFCEDFGEELEELKEKIINDRNLQSLFNGIHRFIKDDFKANNLELSNNQVHKRSKDIAYRVIRRSRAWDRLLLGVFPNTLRLSIHPYPMNHQKFGIKLVPSSNRWATPWHNVVVKENDSYQLMKRKEALEIGYVEKRWGGEYVYYERA